MPKFGSGMIAGLNWTIRSYQKSPEGELLNEKFNYFCWGGFGQGDISAEFVWQIGSLKMYVQDGRWSETDQLKMRIKDGAIIIEVA